MEGAGAVPPVEHRLSDSADHMLLLVLGPDCDTCKEALEVFVGDGLERET